MIVTLLFVIVIGLFGHSVLADSIILKRGHYEIKGFVLDNFCDRILINTFKGEKIIEKEKIEKVIFDDRDRELVFKAQNILEGEQIDEKILSKARYFFQEALRVNPSNRDAELGLGRVRDELLKLKNPQIGFLGMALSLEGSIIKVFEVIPRSPAGMGGVRVGDILFSIWDKKIRYDKMATIIRLLSGPPGSPVTFAIEREVAIGYRTKAARNLKDVLMVTRRGIFPKLGGIEDTLPTDKVVSICGNDTRYITNEYFFWFSENFRNKNVIITIRRAFNLTRGSFKLEE